MIGTWIGILGLLLLGGRASDGLRTAQLESILTRLPPEEARAYYEQLRRRLRKVAVLRALALAALLVLFWSFRQMLHRHLT